jgi:hypothetical protein
VVTPFAFRGFFLRHEADSGSCGSYGPREQVSEMPAFWPANIAAWFASVEGVFELRDIIKGGPIQPSDLDTDLPIESADLFHGF